MTTYNFSLEVQRNVGLRHGRQRGVRRQPAEQDRSQPRPERPASRGAFRSGKHRSDQQPGAARRIPPADGRARRR